MNKTRDRPRHDYLAAYARPTATADARQPNDKTYEGIRDNAPSAFTAEHFIAPHGACFDASGNIFITEWVEYGRVSKLRRIA